MAENALRHDEQNYFTATEIAHLLPLTNLPLFLRYVYENRWIMDYFPHLRVFDLKDIRCGRRRSIVSAVLEVPFRIKLANWLENHLLDRTRKHWEDRYADIPESTRRKIFKSELNESRAYAGDFAGKILKAYGESLQKYGLDS